MIQLITKYHQIQTKYNRIVICMGSSLMVLLLAACNLGATPTQTLTPPSTRTPIDTATANPTSTTTPPFTHTPTTTPIPTRTRPPTRTSAPTRTGTLVVSESVDSCPGAPDITLKVGDWARVSMEPPLPNRVRSQPGSSGELIGQVLPGENLLILDGPRCADGYTWWYVRSLDGLEGWTAEGDAGGYWLVEPISVWYQLPKPLTSSGVNTYDLREISISADAVLVSGISGNYLPLATPMPRPQTAETPEPNDPRYSEFGTVSYAAHSNYDVSSTMGVYLIVFDLEDSLSRYYLNRMSHDDYTQVLRKNLDSKEIVPAYLNPFCGINGRIPIHFIADIKPIQFVGGKGVRFLISSANYQTVNKLEYIFQGLSDDGRYFIRGHIRSISHPYMVDAAILLNDFGPLLAWKEGQYEEAQKSYDVFNARIEQMLNAGAVTLYPSLELLDSMMASIVIK